MLEHVVNLFFSEIESSTSASYNSECEIIQTRYSLSTEPVGQEIIRIFYNAYVCE